MVVTDQHRLEPAQWLPSPHFDERSPYAGVELVVVHCVSLPEGEYGTGYPKALFQGELDVGVHESFADLEGLRVAPHLMIERSGALLQFVAFDKRAWHAGLSRWRGRDGCNDFSIGIELEGSVDDEYTQAQYLVLQQVFASLLARYESLSIDSVVGHNEIAAGRKEDPGPGFDWSRVLTHVHTAFASDSRVRD